LTIEDIDIKKPFLSVLDDVCEYFSRAGVERAVGAGIGQSAVLSMRIFERATDSPQALILLMWQLLDMIETQKS